MKIQKLLHLHQTSSNRRRGKCLKESQENKREQNMYVWHENNFFQCCLVSLCSHNLRKRVPHEILHNQAKVEIANAKPIRLFIPLLLYSLKSSVPKWPSYFWIACKFRISFKISCCAKVYLRWQEYNILKSNQTQTANGTTTSWFLTFWR